MAGVREQTVTLTAPYTAGTGTMSLGGPFLGAIETGTVLAVGMNILLVEGITRGGAASVQGGYAGSTDVSALDGAVAYINTRFPRFDIGVAINDDLLDLSAPPQTIGQVLGVDATWNPAFMGYDLGSTFDGMTSIVLDVNFTEPQPTRRHPRIRRGDYRVIRNQSSTDFPSGNGIIFYKPGFPGLPVRVTFLAPFSPLVNLTDDLTAVAGLPNTLYDVPDLGASLRLMDPREVSRSFLEAEADPRKSPETPPGAINQSQVQLAKRRQDRIDGEYERIRRAYPQAEAF